MPAAALALAAGLFASCTKTIVQDCPYTIKTVAIDVPQEAWQYSNFENNNYFYATVSMPELNQTAFKTGMIKMYRVFDAKLKTEYQMELPYTRHTEAKDEMGEKYFFTETIDYDFGVGDVNIYYTVNNFSYEQDWLFTPEPMDFRLVIMY